MPLNLSAGPHRSSLFERTKGQFDRLALVMVSIKAGVEHLRDQFSSLPIEFRVPGGVTEDTLPDVVRCSGDRLVDVHTKTKDSELQMRLTLQDTKCTELERSASALQSRRPMSHGAPSGGRPFNQRIPLPSAKEVSAFDHDSDDDAGIGGDDAGCEEISRDGVKRASSNIVAMEERRKLRSRKPEDG